MCCRIRVRPIGPNAERILAIAGFTGNARRGWSRKFEDETRIDVTADQGDLVLNVHPPIRTVEDHQRQRLAAAVSFKISAYLAEDAGGEIVHEGSQKECLTEREKSDVIVGRYPSDPFTFRKLCRGFREVFLGSQEQN